jgi:subtilisin family serine protease
MTALFVALFLVSCGDDAAPPPPSADAGVAPERDADAPDGGAPAPSCLDACLALDDAAGALCGEKKRSLAVELRGSSAAFRAAARDAGVTDVRAIGARVLLREVDLEARRALRAHSDVARELPVDARGRVLTGEVAVALARGADIAEVARAANASVIRALALGPDTWLLRADSTFDLENDPRVRWATPNRLYHVDRRLPVADPEYGEQWHLNGARDAMPGADIAAELAWSITEGDPSAIIAVYDDGVDLRHPDLAPHLVEGIAVPADLDEAIAEGCCWHGTSVAGVAAAAGNAIGGRGVCPGCSLMPGFQDLEGLGEEALDAERLAAICRAGAGVINNSWGPADGSPSIAGDEHPPEPLSPLLDESFSICEREGRGGLGTVIVFAAGNGNEPVSGDPLASHPLVVAVGASTDRGIKAAYSDFGPELDVVAPSDGGGRAIFTTALASEGFPEPGVPDGYTATFGGTSSAAPVVAGVVGLILSANPGLTAAEVRDVLAETAVPIDRVRGRYDETSPYYGHGLVNAYLAVRRAEALAGRCTALPSELCNGVDDTCDAIVDEGCEPREACAPCVLDAECGDGVCALSGGDDHAVCLARCESTCGDGFACSTGLCLPIDGRCDAPSAEICNGVDDDLDGRADGVPICGPDAFCGDDSSCGEGRVCAAGFCASICTDASSCGTGETCEPRATIYGEADGSRVCNLSFEYAFCEEGCSYPDVEASILACHASPPASCDDVELCFFPE